MLRADQRLRRGRDFDAVFQRGRRFSGGALSIRALERGGGPDQQPARYGFSISSRLGGAVVRNRIRRRLRASARGIAADGWDFVITARNGAAEADYADLDRALRRLVERALSSSPPSSTAAEATS